MITRHRRHSNIYKVGGWNIGSSSSSSWWSSSSIKMITFAKGRFAQRGIVEFGDKPQKLTNRVESISGKKKEKKKKKKDEMRDVGGSGRNALP